MRVWLRLVAMIGGGCVVFTLALLLAGHGLRGGDMVAFSSNREELGEIYLLDINHNLTVNLTRFPGDDSSASASPDGRYIAFETSRDGNREIYLTDMNSFSTRNLTHNPARDMIPAWSPDGRQMVAT